MSRQALALPESRFVDDYFGCDFPEVHGPHERVHRSDVSFPHQVTEHAKMCFARLVRAMLGPGAISDRKLDHGPTLMVLGLMVRA